MGMFRNMEVVLMLCFGLIVTAAMVAGPSPHEDAAVEAQDHAGAQMPVVVVTGKRLSIKEKVQSPGDAG